MTTTLFMASAIAMLGPTLMIIDLATDPVEFSLRMVRETQCPLLAPFADNLRELWLSRK